MGAALKFVLGREHQPAASTDLTDYQADSNQIRCKH